MCVNNVPKVATQWNSGATRDSNRGRQARIPSALTTRPPSNIVTDKLSQYVDVVPQIDPIQWHRGKGGGDEGAMPSIKNTVARVYASSKF